MSNAPLSTFAAKRAAPGKSVVTSIERQRKSKGGLDRNLSPNSVPKRGTFGEERRRNTRSLAHRINDRTVKIRPQSDVTPTWLRAAIALQHRSSIVTFLLVSAVLVVYGSTVYSQQLWSQEYRKLETLQRKERQLTAAGEVLKNDLAQQAQRPDAGLVSPTPDNNLFLEPSPIRSIPTSEQTDPFKRPDLSPTPVGY